MSKLSNKVFSVKEVSAQNQELTKQVQLKDTEIATLNAKIIQLENSNKEAVTTWETKYNTFKAEADKALADAKAEYTKEVETLSKAKEDTEKSVNAKVALKMSSIGLTEDEATKVASDKVNNPKEVTSKHPSVKITDGSNGAMDYPAGQSKFATLKVVEQASGANVLTGDYKSKHATLKVTAV